MHVNGLIPAGRTPMAYAGRKGDEGASRGNATIPASNWPLPRGGLWEGSHLLPGTRGRRRISKTRSSHTGDGLCAARSEQPSYSRIFLGGRNSRRLDRKRKREFPRKLGCPSRCKRTM